MEKLGQHLLIIRFSSKCHVNHMRVGGSLSLFIKSKVPNKQIEKTVINLSFQWSSEQVFCSRHTKYMIVEHRLDCTGEEIAL